VTTASWEEPGGLAAAAWGNSNSGPPPEMHLGRISVRDPHMWFLETHRDCRLDAYQRATAFLGTFWNLTLGVKR
jgi:hypothetical protein